MCFLLNEKKGNITPIHKKGHKQNIKNYRPVSLLPICGKIFERLIFNEMFIYFSANKLTSKNQPVSNPVIPVLTNCYQLPTKFLHLLIMDVRSVFLDISKAFDKVWHEGLIFKLKQNDISGELLHILSDFVSSRKQKVALNGQNSSWTNVHAGVPQGSILGPLLFLIYINDLSDNLTSNAKLFADDTSVFSVVYDVNTSAKELND